MKRAFVLIAIAALLVCVIPMVDSSDAAGETTISGYLYNPTKDLSSVNTYICIIYSDDGGNTGEIIGETKTVATWDEKKLNKFTVTIEPNADRTITHYYIFFNFYGYAVLSAPPTFLPSNIKIEDVTYTDCYSLNGSDIVDGPNEIGSTSSGWFIMESAQGTVSGKVTMKTDGLIYLTGIRVTIFDLSTNKNLESTTTDDDGFYSITYDTGKYGIRFEMGGYDTVNDEITIVKGATIDVPAVMTKNESYFGFDLSHALMILGGTAAVILLLFTIIVRVRLSKR